MRSTLALFLLLVQTVLYAQSSLIQIDSENHLYQRLTVEVTDQVPRHLCQETLSHLEELLTSTSEKLYTATKTRFDTINILLPTSWSGSDCLNGRPINDQISFSPQPDFKVTAEHPLFGATQPLTIQFDGQCGTMGRGIQLPYPLLASTNLTESTKLSTFREWIRYRYGTFAESGFENDPLYPLMYQYGAEEKSSQSCGNLTQNDFSGDQMVDASIEQFHKNTAAFCDVTTNIYDRDAPTKQNLLCHRQAVQEVLFNHPDLKDSSIDSTTTPEEELLKQKIRHVDSFKILEENSNEDELSLGHQQMMEGRDPPADVSFSREFVQPRFAYVLPARRRHILVLDVSEGMNRDRQWEMARNALFRFITQIPEGDEVGIVSFGANAKINIEPTEVTALNREGLYGRVPFRLLKGQQGCLECGLRMAIKLLDTPRQVSNGAIIVLTGTTQQQQHSTVLTEMASIIEQRALPVYMVAFDYQISHNFAKLAKYGSNFVIQKGYILQNIADTLMEILNQGRDLDQRLVKAYERRFSLDNNRNHRHHEIALTSGGKRGVAISGNFVVENDLRSNVWIILTSPYKEDVELFEITSPSGQRKAFPKFENGIVYFHMEGLSEAGIWSYKASIYPVVSSSTLNEVTVEVVAQPTVDDTKNEKAIKVEAWTNVDIEKGASAMDKPVVIYARLTKGQNLPIMDAEVLATVQRPDSSVAFEVVLKDIGTGYPDITSGDGIYSGYFTGFSTEKGLYGLDIKVSHNEGQAITPSLLLNNNNNLTNTNCCGGGSMYVPLNQLETTPTQQFTRYIKAAAFYVTQGAQYFVSNGQPEMDDMFPPSRVTDLKVKTFDNNTLYVTLQWSAPGGDFDLGKADSYEVRWYTNAEGLSDTNFAQMGIGYDVHESLLPQPGDYGQVQTATVNLPWANAVFYYGLVTLDAAGNRSPVSNLVPVYVAEVLTTGNGGEDADGNEVTVNEHYGNALSGAVRAAFGSNEVLIYIVAGVISGLVLIISLIVIVSVCRAKHKKAEEKRKQNARTQIFVNDLEHSSNSSHLPDIASHNQGSLEKPPQNYSEVWATHSSANHHMPNSNSPTNSSLEEYANMMYNSSRTYPNSYQPPLASYNTVPVHDYRSHHVPALTAPNNGSGGGQIQYGGVAHHHPSSSGDEVGPMGGHGGGDGVTPTYQNWGHKPPSDNGTATTSSTECYDDHNSDHSKNVRVTNTAARRYSVDDYLRVGNSTDPTSALSLSPSFCSSSEKRRRQESLV